MRKLLFALFLLTAPAWGTEVKDTVTAEGTATGTWTYVGAQGDWHALNNDDGSTNYSTFSNGNTNGDLQSWKYDGTSYDQIDSIYVVIKYGRTGTSGVGRIDYGIRSGATDNFAVTALVPTTTFKFDSVKYTTDPNTGLAWTPLGFESAEILAKAATVPGGSTIDGITLAYIHVYGSNLNIPAQAPAPCGLHTGDTLYPVGAGQSTGLTLGAGGSANWSQVDERPDSTGGSGGCSAAGDTNYTSNTAITWDWYKVRARNVSAPTVWKSHISCGGAPCNSVEQIDALAVVACCHITASGTLSVQFAVMDSVGGQDTVFSPIFTTSSTGKLAFSWYFWNIDGASNGGNKWYNATNPRWDSTSLMGLQVGVGLARSSGGTKQAVIDNIYTIVGTSTRDSTIADSVSPNLATTADTTGNSVHTVHPQGAYNSPLSSKERYWATSVDNATDNIYTIVASNDTGKTWTYMNPDTLQVRRANDALNASVTGPQIIGDTTANFTDSLFYMIGKPTLTANKMFFHRSKAPSLTGSDWASAGVSSPAGRRDSLTRQDFIISAAHACTYEMGDTIWAATLDTSSGNNIGAVKIFRFVYISTGLTIVDSSYVPALPLRARDYDNNPRTDSMNTTNTRRMVFIPWKNKYPALVAWGWNKDSNTTVTQTRICMYK